MQIVILAAMMSRLTTYRSLKVTFIISMIWILVITLWWAWPERNIKKFTLSVSDMTSFTNSSSALFQSVNIKTTLDKQLSNKQNIPVYIVEEHHEVLPYWFNSANSGILPKQGNTLIHIDAHSDAALPSRPRRTPDFKYPRSSRDIYWMIQENDSFIMQSIVTGLLDRFIYIYSSWDTEQLAEYSDFSSYVILFGKVITKARNSSALWCKCTIEEYKEGNCTQHSGYRGMDEMNIPATQCEVKRKFQFDVVAEKRAVELMTTENWISKNENVILDIDEDFYGCEAACMPLYDVGVPEHVIESLKSFVNKTFCAKNTLEEKKFDKVFHHLTKSLSVIKPFTGNLSATQKHTQELSQTVTEDILQELTHQDLSLCPSANPRSSHNLNALVVLMLKHSPKQLKTLGEVGLCLDETPKSIYFKSINGMRLCDGYNRPNHTVVFFHTPTVDEINERTITLKNILRKIPNPNVVTICRSMRDGYTPRKFFHKIESDVLESLQDIFTDITKDSIHYDKDLLGGRHGWPDRHQNSL